LDPHRRFFTLLGPFDTILAWPESVREQVARWIAPNGALADETVSENNGAKYSPAPNGAPRPNGHDRRPPRQAKARPQNKFNTRTAELKLLEALQRSAGSVSALAKAAGASKSSTGERLRGLASRGVVTKERRALAACGRACGSSAGPYVAAVGELTAEPEAAIIETFVQGAENPAQLLADDPEPKLAAPEPWIRSVNYYVRRSIYPMEVGRYG
jgi:hypothetical protein